MAKTEQRSGVEASVGKFETKSGQSLGFGVSQHISGILPGEIALTLNLGQEF